MSRPLLSICISTYNREKYLKQLLDSIIAQGGFSDEIEICIYNDPSEDNTQSMIEEYQEKYQNIKYHRNEKRIGMIPSILNAAQMWNWEYVWLFSDDDIMDSRAIKIMLDTIKKEQPWLILNKFLWFKDESDIKNIDTNLTWNIINVIGMEKLFDFFSTVKYSIDGYMMHCSLFCFKKDLFIKNLHSLLKEYWEDYMDILNKDYFGHVRIVYLPFGNTEKITIIEKDLVLLRWGNISWSFVFKVCTDYRDLIQDLNRRYRINKRTHTKMKILYYYSVFTYIVIVHMQQYIPKRLYSTLVSIGKKLVRIIKIW